MKWRSLSAFLLAAYGVVLIRVMVFKDLPLIRIGNLMLNFGGTDTGHAPNFVPFKTIIPYVFGFKGWIIAGINLAGNIGLLVPVGFLAPFVFRNMTWKKSLALGVVSGCAIELMQVVLRVGIFDIDDVILNALGVMVGYFIYHGLAQLMASKFKMGAVAAITVVIAISLYGIGINPKIRLSAAPQNVEQGSQSAEGSVPAKTGDLCGGTGGTGEIIEVETGKLSIRRNDGLIQTFTITQQSVIRNIEGPITASDLRLGDRVTLVVLDTETASTVLVCGASMKTI